MSAQDAVRFLVRVGSQPELQEQLRAATPDIPALGRALGFSFSQVELAQVLQAEVGELTDAQLEGASGGVQTAAVGQLATGGGAVDPNALVQEVLRASYLEQTEDLRFFAEKVKYFNTCKKLIRDYL